MSLSLPFPLLILSLSSGNGIGIEECAHVDLQGVKALFSLSVNSSPLDDYLVISLAHETHILEICGEELEDTTIEGTVEMIERKNTVVMCRSGNGRGDVVLWNYREGIDSTGLYC